VDRRVDHLPTLLGVAQDALEERQRHLRPARRALGDRRDVVLDDRAPEPLDREVVQRRQRPEAVLGDPDRPRPRPHPAGRADDVAVEPRLGDDAEPLRRRLVEDAGLMAPLDVELERPGVPVDREDARVLARPIFPKPDLVAPLSLAVS
jgi:hypothetical protein